MPITCCQRTTTKKLRKIDPTRTLSIRKAFVSEMKRRFKKLKAEIKRAIVDLDVFAIEKKEVKTNLSERQFQFSTSAEKIDRFMEWLQEMVNQHVLEVRKIVGLRGRGNRAWMDVYIQSAYRKGVGKAFGELKRLGIPGYEKGIEEGITGAFNRPFHADRLGIIYSRDFQKLKKITGEMSGQISDVLAEGMGKGLGVEQIARDVVDRVDKIGVARSATLARTEVVHAHAEANLNEFEVAGIEGVNLQAEWLTAGDGLVCPLCLEGERKNPYTIEEARGLVPRHPNCRCVWIPYTKEWES